MSDTPEPVTLSLRLQMQPVDLAEVLVDGGLDEDAFIEVVREVDEAVGEWGFSLRLAALGLELLLQYAEEESHEALESMAVALRDRVIRVQRGEH